MLCNSFDGFSRAELRIQHFGASYVYFKNFTAGIIIRSSQDDRISVIVPVINITLMIRIFYLTFTLFSLCIFVGLTADISAQPCANGVLANITCAADPLKSRSVTDANQTCSSQSNALYLSGLASNYTSNQRYTIQSGTFEENSNGTAVFTGTFINQGNSNVIFNGRVVFSGRTYSSSFWVS